MPKLGLQQEQSASTTGELGVYSTNPTENAGIKLHEGIDFQKEFDRLSEDNRSTIDGQQIWRNSGALAIGVFDLTDVFDELTSLAEEQFAEINISTTSPIPGRFIKKRVLSTIHGSDTSSTAVKGADALHESVHTLLYDVDVHSISTRITSSRMTRRTSNTQAHVDTPHRYDNPHISKKVNIIYAQPDRTEFLEDGYEFDGNYDAIFDNNGGLRDEAGLAGKFVQFGEHELVAFGAKSTVHAEPLHDPTLVDLGIMRCVAKVMIVTA